MTSTAPQTHRTTAQGAAHLSCVLDISGMTCAACVNRVEQALSRVDGVHGATVNLATETATVSFDPGKVRLDDLGAAVARAGYIGTPRRPAAEPRDGEQPDAAAGRDAKPATASSSATTGR
jgi:P-type Cu+ transporter